MSRTYKHLTDRETYLARAAEARADAEAATLDNVRERCLRSEAAWIQMAARAQRTEAMRETLAAEKDASAEPLEPPPAAAAGSDPAAG